MILITGPTGNIGSEVLRQLADAGEQVRVLALNPSEPGPVGKNVEIVQGDLNNRRSVRAALRSVEKVFLVAPGPDIPTQERIMIEEAQAARVRHLVQVSSLGVEDGYGGGPMHFRGEQLLTSSRLAWTILRPAGFMSNILHGAETIRSQGVYYAPTGSGKYPYIDPVDISSVAVKALTTPGHEGKRYRLTGGQAITAADQTETLSKVIGKPVKHVDIPSSALRGNMSEDHTEPIIRFYDLVRAGELEQVLPTVEQLLGRKPRTFEAWAREHAGAFR